MDLESEFYFEQLSIRAQNILLDNKFNHIDELTKFYLDNKTFRNLRGCGVIVNRELVELCQSFLIINKKNENINISDHFKEFNEVYDLNLDQRIIVNNHIETLIKNISVRSYNAISHYLNGNFKIQNLYEKVLIYNEFDFKKLKNVGELTVLELKGLIDNIKDFLLKITLIKEEKVILGLKNKYFIESNFNNVDIPIEIIESNSIFKIVEFLLNRNVIFERKVNLIFCSSFKIFKLQEILTVDEIASKINISRQRVRQIKKNCLEDLEKKFQLLKNLDNDYLKKYGIDARQEIIIIDEKLCNQINYDNETSFTKEFLNILIYSALSNTFDLIGNIEDVLADRNFNIRERYAWKNLFLVKRDLAEKFEANEFVFDLNKRLNEKIEETYYFNFQSYLARYLKDYNLNLLGEITKVAEEIIKTEFELFLDIHENLVFYRNTVKQITEYVVEVLETLGEPSSLDDIYEVLELRHPGLSKSKDALRGSLQRTPEIIYFGRSSTYGLKKWETEKTGIKGGTIRKIVHEYLEQENEPKHISNIANYVLKYRPNTYERSILDNLKADETKTFIFFTNSTIGINSKKYDKSFKEINQIETIKFKSWNERFDELISFLNLNNRIPFSSGCAIEEIKLYRWFKIQVKRAKKGELNVEQDELITNVINDFDGPNKIKNNKGNKEERYNDLKEFVTLNNRLPSANKKGEENLYHFFYKQKKLYEQKLLDVLFENKLIEIAKIIQNKKYENKRD